jgi:hypothetical protein
VIFSDNDVEMKKYDCNDDYNGYSMLLCWQVFTPPPSFLQELPRMERGVDGSGGLNGRLRWLPGGRCHPTGALGRGKREGEGERNKRGRGEIKGEWEERKRREGERRVREG